MANNISRYKNGMSKIGRTTIYRGTEHREHVSLTQNRLERRAIDSAQRKGKSIKLKRPV